MPTLTADGKRLNGRRSGHWLPAWRRLALYLRDSFQCAYCGRDLHAVAPREITLDHLTPQCRGGGHENRNLVTACQRCNSARGAKLWYRYATGGARDRIAVLRRRAIPVRLAKAILAGDVMLANARLEAR